MHKKDVPGAIQLRLNSMVATLYIDNVFGVCDVSGLLFGRPSTTVSHGVSIGSNYGLPKAIL